MNNHTKGVPMTDEMKVTVSIEPEGSTLVASNSAGAANMLRQLAETYQADANEAADRWAVIATEGGSVHVDANGKPFTNVEDAHECARSLIAEGLAVEIGPVKTWVAEAVAA
jgi:hypothetical protein